MTLHTVMTNRWRCMVGFGCKPTHRRVTSRQSVKTARSSPREPTTQAQRTRPNGDHPQYVLLGEKVKVKFPRAQVLNRVIVGTTTILRLPYLGVGFGKPCFNGSEVLRVQKIGATSASAG